MSFGERLDILSGIFNINGNRLARAISVDPSLISKWKSNKRLLKANSVFADRIASYFSNMDAPEFQKREMLKQLNKSGGQINPRETEDTGKLREMILEWLFSEESTLSGSTNMVDSEADPKESILRIISGVKSIPAITSAAKLTPPEGNLPRLEWKPGDPFTAEIYSGNEGKRQAIMNFFNIALDSEEPLDIYLTSQNDMTWLTEDKQYLSLWTKTLIRVFSMGHRLKMIHNLDRSLSDIVTILNNWLLITMTGRVESYYYPRYQSKNVMLSLMIMKGKLGIMGMSPENQSSGNYFVLYRDPTIVKNLEQIFLSILSDCQPMIKGYSLKRVLQMEEDLIENLYSPGHFYAFGEGLNSRLIPRPLFITLLERAGFSGAIMDTLLNNYDSINKLFLSNLKNYSHREIYTGSVFEKILRDKSWEYSNMEFFGRSVTENAEELKLHLRHIIMMLVKYPNYEIAIKEEHQPELMTRTHLAQKESHFLSVGAFDMKGDHSVLFSTGESTIMHAFEEYFNEMWDSIPKSHKSKEQVIQKLKKYIMML